MKLDKKVSTENNLCCKWNLP